MNIVVGGKLERFKVKNIYDYFFYFPAKVYLNLNLNKINYMLTTSIVSNSESYLQP